MLDIAGIFKNRQLNPACLLAFGFEREDENYSISHRILDGQFQMNIVITNEGAVSVRVLDTDSQDEYVLVHTPGARGAFVGLVKQACEEKLQMIAANCYDNTVFSSEQAKQIIAYADQAHHDQLEFLWEKSPNNAILRRKDKGKWYAAILTVSKAKLGLEGNEFIEVIDLRAAPDEIEHMIDGTKYFPGYHMNKKHWFTICLDGSVSTQEIFQKIEKSYLLVKWEPLPL